ncbi:hypothetical protein Asppvi_009027 [Aspergillus pseudoviridinutans]|uniref:Probable beta-glucosidase M n=1 Tax=Aspergillus pseudoviridinutans TaxID=1517512 RepID=A0A9P3BKM2_9EURO|nr:uncharacterized protein Asppvi_009027 [Aspergillus pseudoviridinutans]GIJ90078.1 hypothetical protein Asppvi_009027 [Aspergillus pseudoviridinutans]
MPPEYSSILREMVNSRNISLVIQVFVLVWSPHRQVKASTSGPVISPLGRTARGGRNWEGFSADPYLAGVLVAEIIQGLQMSVKHFIAYDQETARGAEGNNASYSSNIDDKTMHELYLWPFANAVYAGVGSVMCFANAGLDMAMPDSPYWQGNLSLAVAKDTMSQETLGDMATRNKLRESTIHPEE